MSSGFYCMHFRRIPVLQLLPTGTGVFFLQRIGFGLTLCVIYENEKHYVFFEELIYKENGGRGHICVTELNKNGEMTKPVIILKQPYHLSYPHVFRYNDEYYLIPESQENGTIQLYRAVNFPYEWEFKMNLMENVRAVDATIIQKDDRVWLFANIQELDGVSSCEELFLFSSDDLLSGNWTPHPLNPVVSDVKSSRPAGRIFCHKNKLYRPSQDCSYRYGYATEINEIQELTTEQYREKSVSAITPDWDSDILGTHSISFENGLSVIDAIVKRKNEVSN
ncbi:MAG: glycoside hydrolase family 32 protein [Bacteroidia bacterium]|nr:glycoside hydrolase family 32 protein [Bacteroidia bacterium]